MRLVKTGDIRKSSNLSTSCHLYILKGGKSVDTKGDSKQSRDDADQKPDSNGD